MEATCTPETVGKIFHIHTASQPKNGIHINNYHIKQLYLFLEATHDESLDRTATEPPIQSLCTLLQPTNGNEKLNLLNQYFIPLFIALLSCRGNFISCT
jgi:hypothetical protein